MENIKFKYHPNLYESGMVDKHTGICQCCGRTVKGFIDTMYTDEDVDCICLSCVADGSAAEKFNGTFVKYAETEKVDDPEKTEELFKRTPGYINWEGEHWLACCNDYCEFIGEVGTYELKQMGIAEEVFKTYDEEFGEYDDLEDYMIRGGLCSGYLFKCRVCGRYRMYVDSN